jgi:hypothetical protein
MSALEPIQLTDGETLLIIVKDGRVTQYTWDMALSHIEFVKRRVGELPAGAWVWVIVAVVVGFVMVALFPPPAGKTVMVGISPDWRNIPGDVLGLIAGFQSFRASVKDRKKIDK